MNNHQNATLHQLGGFLKTPKLIKSVILFMLPCGVLIIHNDAKTLEKK
jgi:hypothetical protein